MTTYDSGKTSDSFGKETHWTDRSGGQHTGNYGSGSGDSGRAGEGGLSSLSGNRPGGGFNPGPRVGTPAPTGTTPPPDPAAVSAFQQYLGLPEHFENYGQGGEHPFWGWTPPPVTPPTPPVTPPVPGTTPPPPSTGWGYNRGPRPAVPEALQTWRASIPEGMKPNSPDFKTWLASNPRPDVSDFKTQMRDWFRTGLRGGPPVTPPVTSTAPPPPPPPPAAPLNGPYPSTYSDPIRPQRWNMR